MRSPLRIVVADDEQDTREYFTFLLTRCGHEVRAVSDGQQLLQVCREFCPDVVVTDFAMPGMTGLAVAKEMNRSARVPFVLVSGRHIEVPSEMSGLTRVLIKPVKERELKLAVEILGSLSFERLGAG